MKWIVLTTLTALSICGCASVPQRVKTVDETPLHQKSTTFPSHNPAKDQPITLDRAISLAASIAACISAMAAFLTIKQVIKQRQATYQPDLVLATTFFTARVGSDKNWTFKQIGSPESRSIHIPLANIGLGSAKHLHVSWACDIEALVTDTSAYLLAAGRSETFNYSDGIVHFKSGSTNSVSMWRNQITKKIDHLLPIAHTDHPARLEIPMAYMTLLAANIESRLNDRGDFDEALPSISAVIAYYAIDNQRMQTRFELEPSLQMLTEGKFEAQMDVTPIQLRSRPKSSKAQSV